MLSRLLTVVAVVISVLEAAPPAGGYQCWNFGSTDEIRFEYLNAVNKLRTQIADGSAQCKDQKPCPQGKNIYRLDWDCLLEIEAQKAADQCTENPTGISKESTIVRKVEMTTCNPKPLFKETVNKWWEAVKDVAVEENKPIPNNEQLANFAKLAHGKATRIGCAQKNCNGNLYVACVVFPEGPKNGEPIYEVGKGCANADECNTYAGSKCNKNVCRAGYIDPSATTTTTTTTTTTPTTTTPTTTTPTTTTTQSTSTSGPTAPPTPVPPVTTTTAPPVQPGTTPIPGTTTTTVAPGKP
ncbi:hypothetical protein Y032_0633g889 [Ancylostoma ceylanicum]|uniref:SCP domain-containing protein n=1 Tax=Ancylostoma ceylanicum TaxID=53326 RepID=A0A016WK37_9BILA|nr:hypothetical protein Y032_0633g889 [Ancylostoma ceylanicum]